MNQSTFRDLGLLLSLICPLSLRAQSGAPPAPTNPPVTSAGVTSTKSAAPSSGLLNDWLRGQSSAFQPWDLGGQFRARLEYRDEFAVPGFRPTAVDFRDQGGAENGYLLLREKIHLGYKPVSWFNAFVEGRDSSSPWDRRTPAPESDRIDLHQAYAILGDPSIFPVTAKIGRQELIYGDERVVGAFDWNNIGRVFDAAKLRYEQKEFWVDSWIGRVIIPNNHEFNVANDYDVFSGVYASTRTLIPKQETQVYFLARNTGADSPTAIGQGLPAFKNGASPRDIYTMGMRIKSLPGQFAGWDYETELAGQFGNYHATASSPRLDQQAFAAHVAGGYTWTKAFASPRVGLEYNFSSGDSDPTDNKHETFDNLFPTNHKFYGFMDLFSWQNIHNARLSTSVKPLPKLTLTGDYHAFWLADTHDYFYQVNGSPRSSGGYGLKPQASSFVGTELDIIASYAFSSWLSLQGGYGHFFVGNYVEDSLKPVGGAQDANWVYAQMVFTF